ncbi:hypothetical protein [Streptomyces lunalinharesii]|uniref:Alpha/beta hydrolase n=1 Tax=Streptomyces lunalinharesii TaxID=333384 RepID=A0ABP6EUT7_9ACTN
MAGGFRRIAELIPCAVYTERPDAGHRLHAGHHARLDADLGEFLKR